jgi:hypothetical protein
MYLSVCAVLAVTRCAFVVHVFGSLHWKYTRFMLSCMSYLQMLTKKCGKMQDALCLRTTSANKLRSQ